MSQKFEVKILNSAEEDLNDIILYIALDNKEIAFKIFDRLYEKIMRLEQFPEQGRIVPELMDQNITEYRELIETPWRIIYTISNDTVYVYEVIDGRRNVQDILIKKLLKK